MSFRVHRSERSRHLVLRAPAGQLLPLALVETLRRERVAAGWLRGSGVLEDVELKAYDGQHGEPGSVRRIAGRIQVLSLEGSVGLVDGRPATSLRALLARESDSGLETRAGEIVSARIVGLELLVTVLDDSALGRSLDVETGMWLLDLPVGAVAAASPAAATHLAPVAPMPARPTRAAPAADGPTPEGGDVVEHFAFGPCDVLKSDGDRLHLRLRKDGRIREIALEMLRVIPLAPDGERRRFGLERRI